MIPDPFVVRLTLERMSLHMAQAVAEAMDKEQIVAAIKAAVEKFDMAGEIDRLVQTEIRNVLHMQVREEITSKFTPDKFGPLVRQTILRQLSHESALDVLEREAKHARDRGDWDTANRMDIEASRIRRGGP